jgi:hypothetical protein
MIHPGNKIMETITCDNCGAKLCIASGDLNCCEFYCDEGCKTTNKLKKNIQQNKEPKTIIVQTLTFNKEGTLREWTNKEIINPNYMSEQWKK